MTAAVALRRNWPEYLIEGWALGTFMISAGLVATALESPASPVHQALSGQPDLRRLLAGLAMGLTAIALIYSPWGQRSGAHMNPAVTATFWMLGKVRGIDALFYCAAQFAGGLLGVVLVAAALGSAFTAPPVFYAATLPGPAGAAIAFCAELLISAGMMTMILGATRSPRLEPWTGVLAGVLVAVFIAVEAPLSGMSMNPARSVASAAPAAQLGSLWIYLLAPPLGMLAAAGVQRRRPIACAKLRHSDHVRCIHCGHEPAPAHAAVQTSASVRSPS